MSGPTTRSNRSRIAIDAPLRGRSRYGCWTCRIRRKKCDEQQDSETGLCGNCSRLQIECVGWGERRPEWIKDPQRLAAFKAQIKNQIISRSRASGSPTPGAPVPSTPVFPDGHTFTLNEASCPCSRETVSSFSPSLTLPPPLIQQPPSLTEQCDYRALVNHVQILAENAEFPILCVEAVEQITSLGLWKQRELDRGALSYKELARRGLVIEELLVSAYERQKADCLALDPPMRRSSDGEEMLVYMKFDDDDDDDDDDERHSNSSLDSWQTLAEPSPTAADAYTIPTKYWCGEDFCSPTSGAINLPVFPPGVVNPAEKQYPDWGYAVGQDTINSRALQDLPYLSALLFLHSIVSGPNPRVPEILDVSGKILEILVSVTVEDIPTPQRLFSAALVCLLSEEEKVKDIFRDIHTSVEDVFISNSAMALMEKRICAA